MERHEKNSSAEESREAAGTVPDKQIQRWKDDRGPVAPEPDPEPPQNED